MEDARSKEALAELADKAAITNLVYRYSRSVDRKDYALLRRLYTASAIDDHGALYCGPAEGYVDWLETASAHVDMLSHQVHNMMVEIDGDVAFGEVYVTAFNRWLAEGGFEELIQGLRYLDRYEREADGWKFANRTVVVDWSELRPGFWDSEHPFLKGQRSGVRGETDPSYAVLTHRGFRRG